MIWGAAGIGVAVGAGFYIEATVCVLLILLCVEFIPFMIAKFGFETLHKRDACDHPNESK